MCSDLYNCSSPFNLQGLVLGLAQHGRAHPLDQKENERQFSMFFKEKTGKCFAPKFRLTDWGFIR